MSELLLTPELKFGIYDILLFVEFETEILEGATFKGFKLFIV